MFVIVYVNIFLYCLRRLFPLQFHLNPDKFAWRGCVDIAYAVSGKTETAFLYFFDLTVLSLTTLAFAALRLKT